MVYLIVSLWHCKTPRTQNLFKRVLRFFCLLFQENLWLCSLIWDSSLWVKSLILSFLGKFLGMGKAPKIIVCHTFLINREMPYKS